VVPTNVGTRGTKVDEQRQRRQVAQDIDRRIKTAIANVEQVFDLLEDDNTPFGYRQIVAYQGRCESVLGDLQQIKDVAYELLQDPT
jgi:hypothetical protein